MLFLIVTPAMLLFPRSECVCIPAISVFVREQWMKNECLFRAQNKECVGKKTPLLILVRHR